VEAMLINKPIAKVKSFFIVSFFRFLLANTSLILKAFTRQWK
jgi:hypothetical protein